MSKKSQNNFEKHPIVMFSMSRWDSHISSASFCLAKELAKRQTVYYVDMPFTIKDVLFGLRNKDIKSRLRALVFRYQTQRDLPDVSPGFKSLIPPMVMPINLLPKGLLHRLLSNFNDWVVCRFIANKLRKFGVSEYTLFNSFNPFYGKALIGMFAPKLKIYQSRDDISTLAYVYKHGPYQEMQQIREADLNIATSKNLAKKLSEISQKEVGVINNGVEIDLFLTTPARQRLKEWRDKKIIFFSGFFDNRIDFELLSELVTRFHQHQFVFVGPVASDEFYKYKIDKAKNVHLTGGLPIKEMIKYLKVSDIAIIPFVKSEKTKSIYPLKINEYLSCNIPVVTTNFSEDLISFNGFISVANSKDEFFQMVNDGLENPDIKNSGQLVNIARQNSWTNRVKQIDELVMDFKHF